MGERGKTAGRRALHMRCTRALERFVARLSASPRLPLQLGALLVSISECRRVHGSNNSAAARLQLRTGIAKRPCRLKGPSLHSPKQAANDQGSPGATWSALPWIDWISSARFCFCFSLSARASSIPGASGILRSAP